MKTNDSLKTALVTGASAGLGVEFARQLAQQGYDLLLVARREDRLKEVASDLEVEFGIGVKIFAADLSDPVAPLDILNYVEREGLEIAYLINNAGASGPDLLLDRDWGEQARFFELMMTSIAHMCHHFIPPMQERGFGRVINVASFAGRLARRAGSNYGPTKTYVIALSEELSLNVEQDGVHVSALCPGFVHTDFHETAGLMEMKRSLPNFIWYGADTVVREGIEAVERNQAVMVSGRIYRWLDPLAQSVWIRPFLKSLAPGR